MPSGRDIQPRKSFPGPVPALRASRCRTDCCAWATISSDEINLLVLFRLILRFSFIFINFSINIYFLHPLPSLPPRGKEGNKTSRLTGQERGYPLIESAYKVKKKADGRNPAALNNVGKYMD
jgi:hypothetical protein